MRITVEGDTRLTGDKPMRVKLHSGAATLFGMPMLYDFAYPTDASIVVCAAHAILDLDQPVHVCPSVLHSVAKPFHRTRVLVSGKAKSGKSALVCLFVLPATGANGCKHSIDHAQTSSVFHRL
jgi:hypothetical protein